MSSVLDLIKASLRGIQVLAKSEEPAADEANDALEAMTMMLQSWSARNLIVRATLGETFVLTADQGSYTIGSGGNFNTTKPVKVRSAFIRDSNNIDSPLSIETMSYYSDLSDKIVSSGRPEVLVYNPGLAQQSTQLGTIYLYSIPDVAYTLGITSTKPLTDFTSLTETVTFDGPYKEAIKYGLMMRLWGEYHKGDPPSHLVALESASLTTLENINSYVPPSAMDVPGSGRASYDIYTGSYDQD